MGIIDFSHFVISDIFTVIDICATNVSLTIIIQDILLVGLEMWKKTKVSSTKA